MDINLLMEDEELMELIRTAEKWQRLVNTLPDRGDMEYSHQKVRDKVEFKVFDSKLEVLDRLEDILSN